MYPYQRVGQAIPAASSSTTPPSLAQQGYTADQGAEIGIAVSAVPLIGLLLGGIALYALSPSDALPKWFWGILGGGLGLAAGNALGVAAVNKILPVNTAQNPNQPTGSFDELAFYQSLGQSLSSQIQSAMSSSTSPATIGPVIPQTQPSQS
jgi:hypothetical protein